jgi:hypothetical protein
MIMSKELREVIKEIDNDGKTIIKFLRDNKFTSDQIGNFIAYFLIVLSIKYPDGYKSLLNFVSMMSKKISEVESSE